MEQDTVKQETSSSRSARLRDPHRYLPDEQLAAAAQIAALLRQPLLLTGDPGAGKTQMAAWVALQLGRSLIRFTAKSTTSAQDLLYRFDSVREFRDAQRHRGLDQEPTPTRAYITFEAIGRAIALTYPVEALEMQASWDSEANLQAGETAARPIAATSSVVLIDEIDKAPRDVPNDLLTEFETGEFLVAEARVRLRVQNNLHPLVIVTSNSERALPDAFLRRCIFHHVEMPIKDRLRKIVRSQFPDLPDGGNFETEALEIFDKLYDPETQIALRRRPSVAELLHLLVVHLSFSGVSSSSSSIEGGQMETLTRSGWKIISEQGIRSGLAGLALSSPETATLIFRQCLAILFKTKEDQDAGREWLCGLWGLPRSLGNEAMRRA